MSKSFTKDFLNVSGAEVGPLKQLIELLKNALEADANKILITADPYWKQIYGINKFAMVDNGKGMSGSFMRENYSVVGDSTKPTGIGLNFGVGGRLSTLFYNSFGVEIRSWQDGKGYMLRIEKDGEDYVLHPFPKKNGDISYVVEIDALKDAQYLKHQLIDKNGTMIVLLGNEPEQDTTLPPNSYDLGLPSWWVSRTLNSQILKVPADVSVRCDFESHQQDREGQHRNIYGLEHPMKNNSIESGSMTTSHGTMNWYILDEDRIEKEYNYGRTLYTIFDKKNSAGHVSVTLNGEIMDVLVDDEGIHTLARFGIIAGGERVAIHINLDKSVYAMNLGRTLIIKHDGTGEFKPERIISKFAKEFIENMPQPVLDHIKNNRNENSGDLNEFVRNQVMKNLENIRYKKQDVLAAVEKEKRGTKDKSEEKTRGQGVRRSGGRNMRKRVSNVYELAFNDEYETKEEIENLIPQFEWQKIESDVAGRYTCESNVVVMNEKFAPYRSMINYGLSLIPENLRPQASFEIESIVQKGISETICCAIVNARINYEGKIGWAGERYEALVGEMGITAVCLSEMLKFGNVKRQMDNSSMLKAITASKNQKTSIQSEAA